MLVRLESRHTVGVAWNGSHQPFQGKGRQQKERPARVNWRTCAYLGMSALGKAKVLMLMRGEGGIGGT
jgi:hypothetical protein